MSITQLYAEPTCRYCHKKASEIDEYIYIAKEEGITPNEEAKMDGTYNKLYNTFICTDCYISRGMPAND